MTARAKVLVVGALVVLALMATGLMIWAWSTSRIAPGYQMPVVTHLRLPSSKLSPTSVASRQRRIHDLLADIDTPMLRLLIEQDGQMRANLAYRLLLRGEHECAIPVLIEALKQDPDLEAHDKEVLWPMVGALAYACYYDGVGKTNAQRLAEMEKWWKETGSRTDPDAWATQCALGIMNQVGQDLSRASDMQLMMLMLSTGNLRLRDGSFPEWWNQNREKGHTVWICEAIDEAIQGLRSENLRVRLEALEILSFLILETGAMQGLRDRATSLRSSKRLADELLAWWSPIRGNFHLVRPTAMSAAGPVYYYVSATDGKSYWNVK